MPVWEGFTEEELKNIKGNQVKKAHKQSGSPHVEPQKKVNTEVQPYNVSTCMGNTKPLSHVAPLQKTHTPQVTVKEEAELSETSGFVHVKCLTATPSIIQKNISRVASVEPAIRERINLDEYEQRRKAIEEQNRKKKETISKALQARKQKTAEETKKLQCIQKEMQKLDALVSNEVAILRQSIEAASLRLSDSQKRYERAEAEFIEAKKDLFDKKEKKELLTEHLCTIIERLEIIKADKLSELLKQLEESSEPEGHNPHTLAPNDG
ncbi:RAB6-interacting golgin-like isoform X2 [Artemia franciscana]|uniref:RAB6-interacting golgin-like isoform X2 n=1 Tax=Artemia franciscana TaxID=6661 RepID=UPI0032DA3B5D